MNADRAEQALYATQDCGGDRVMKARANVVARLFVGKRPRGRDVRTLESVARMSGNTVHDWRAPRKPMAVRRPVRTLRSRVADAAVRIFEAIRAIPGGEPSNWRDAAVFLIGATWGCMCTAGVLLAIAARHSP